MGYTFNLPQLKGHLPAPRITAWKRGDLWVREVTEDEDPSMNAMVGPFCYILLPSIKNYAESVMQAESRRDDTLMKFTVELVALLDYLTVNEYQNLVRELSGFKSYVKGDANGNQINAYGIAVLEGKAMDNVSVIAGVDVAFKDNAILPNLQEKEYVVPRIFTCINDIELAGYIPKELLRFAEQIPLPLLSTAQTELYIERYNKRIPDTGSKLKAGYYKEVVSTPGVDREKVHGLTYFKIEITQDDKLIISYGSDVQRNVNNAFFPRDFGAEELEQLKKLQADFVCKGYVKATVFTIEPSNNEITARLSPQLNDRLEALEDNLQSL